MVVIQLLLVQSIVVRIELEGGLRISGSREREASQIHPAPKRSGVLSKRLDGTGK